MVATEKLVAEWGIEAVNLRDVGREAEQRNNSVVQYHFGTKEILIEAVLDLRIPALAQRYDRLLSELGDRADDPVAVAELLVQPLMELAVTDEGRNSLGFIAAMLTAPHWQPLLIERDDFRAVFGHLVGVVAGTGIPTDLAGSRLRLAWLMAVVSLPSRPDDDLVELRAELIDAVSGVLGAGSRRKSGSGRR